MIVLKRLRAENFKLLRHVELTFPRQGSVLIEGLNESGKSTLFEAVYFALYGAPLVTEGRGKGGLESAIRYGAETASVELALEVGDTELEIRRSLKRGRPSQASLVVRRPGAPEERVAGVMAANARLVEELGGLDGEALLNSCFVEQKKLSKLEDLAAGQRKDSLRKLLNLEKLTDLAERFRVTSQDEQALAEARDRLDLAEVAARLPALVEERSELETCLAGGESVVGGSGGTPHGAKATALREQSPLKGLRGISAATADLRRPPSPFSGHRSFSPTAVGAGVSARPSGSAPSDGVAPARWAWSPLAEALYSVRRSVESARRTGIALACSAGVGLMAAMGLLAAGTESGLWLLPVAGSLAILSACSLRSARAREGEARGLEAELSRRRDLLVAKIGDLEGRSSRAASRLGVDGAALELEECRWEVQRLARQREVKRRAAALVEGAMERIVRLVLPSTERNLAQILPLLTAGRYHEARIGQDYQVQVWDDSAGRYVSKSIFSGGARDQFSLALRLAFALATLPQELGTSPGFLFLDEPLSSFDGPRTEALVRLLTTGQVAASFSQIFVISHSRSFDAAAFPYRLVMRDGKIVESDLPGNSMDTSCFPSTS